MNNYKLTLVARWDKKSKTLNSYPIYLKFKVSNERPKWEYTGVSIEDRKQWNVQGRFVTKHPNADNMNLTLSNLLRQRKEKLIEQTAIDKEITTKSFRKKAVPSLFKYIYAIRGENDITKNTVKHIKAFYGHEPLIRDINIEFCREFETYLRTDLKFGNETILKHFKLLRRVTNQAQLEGHLRKNVLGKGAYRMPAPGKRIPTWLLKPERSKLLKSLHEGKYGNDRNMQLTLVYFLLSCYSGLRYSDIKKFDPEKHVQGDLLILGMQKTGGYIFYPIDKTLFAIIAEIRKIGRLRIGYDYYNANLKVLATDHEIKKPLTSHVGRHTFGSLMAENDVSESDTAYFMGLSQGMVMVYYHITGKIRTDRNRRAELI